MVSNLGDLLSYGYLGIVKLPTHSNSCPSRMISVHYYHVRFWLPNTPIYMYHFDTFPMSERKSETVKRDFVARLLLRSVIRKCLGRQEGLELKPMDL